MRRWEITPERIEYFLSMAEKASTLSKDPSTKVGCVIVDEDNRIVSTGYNGFVAGCNEHELSWERPQKYMHVIHAEMNAVLHARREDLKGSTAFITHSPCINCLKHLLQAKVEKIIYGDASVVRERGTEDEKRAIKQLIFATNSMVMSKNKKNYWEEI